MSISCAVDGGGSATAAAAEAAEERAPHEAFVDLRAGSVFGRDAARRSVLAYVAGDENGLALALHGSAQGVAGRALGLQVVRRLLPAFLATKTRPVLVLEGEAGAGKSALISTCACRVRTLLPDLKLFYHFVGVAPGSTDLVRLLRRLWLELALELPMPPNEDALVRGARDVLAHAGREGGVAIFIDALNQLDSDAEQAQLQWLPAMLPPGVRCVVSVIGGTRHHDMLVNREATPLRVPVGDLDPTACERLVRSLLQGADARIVGDACVAQLLAKGGARNPLWLVSACEELKVVTLPSGSCEAVREAVAGFPDDLLGILQQILGRVEQEHEKRHDGPRLVASLCLLECSRHGLSPSELCALLADGSRLRSVAAVGSEELGEDCLAVVAAAGAGSGGSGGSGSADGAAVGALKGKLHASAQAAVQQQGAAAAAGLRGSAAAGSASAPAAGGPQQRSAQAPHQLLPEEEWQPIFQSLRPFLRPCSSDDEGRLDFFHRAVSKAVRLRYLSRCGTVPEAEDSGSAAAVHSTSRDTDGRRYARWHGWLADYFERCSDTRRRAEELPYHLERVLDNSRLLRSLVQWDVFSRLASTGHGLELLRYCRAAGGFGAVAAALREQLALWGASTASGGGQLAEEELAHRRCVLAEFLTKAGQGRQAVAILEDQDLHIERSLPRVARARRLGLLADAILVDACFGGGAAARLRSVLQILEEAVALWRSVDKAELDQAALAQDLSNLCFQYGQQLELDRAEAAGRESIEIYGKLRHARLGQAQQHMGHVLKSRGLVREALRMYWRSVDTFERTGTAHFDTEYSCSLAAVAETIWELEEDPPWPTILAWQRAAVVSCEAITGRDHAEAAYYRQRLAESLARADDGHQALLVFRGADVELSAADKDAMRDRSLGA